MVLSCERLWRVSLVLISNTFKNLSLVRWDSSPQLLANWFCHVLLLPHQLQCSSAQICQTARTPKAVGDAAEPIYVVLAFSTGSSGLIQTIWAAIFTGRISGHPVPCWPGTGERWWHPTGTSNYSCCPFRVSQSTFVALREDISLFLKTIWDGAAPSVNAPSCQAFKYDLFSSLRRAHQRAAPSLCAMAHTGPRPGSLPSCQMCFACCSAVLRSCSPARLWRELQCFFSIQCPWQARNPPIHCFKQLKWWHGRQPPRKQLAEALCNGDSSLRRANLYVVWQRTALSTSQANAALLLKYKHLKPALGAESSAKADCCHHIIKQHVEVCYSNWAAKNPGGQWSLFIDCSSDQKLDGTTGS